MTGSVKVQWVECDARVREVPAVLRSLARFDDGADAGQSVCDELLADVDALLAVCVASGDERIAEQLVQLKWSIYGMLRPFLRAGGWSEAMLRGFEQSAMCDLDDSQRRLERLRQQVETVRMSRLAGAA